MKKIGLIAAWIIVLGLIGCTQGMSVQPSQNPLPQSSETQPAGTEAPASVETPVSPAQATPSETMNENSQPETYDSAMEPYVQQAKEDLSQRLNLPVDQIEVVEARAVVWPDASLGCPQPGMRYIQVPVDGVLVRLRAEGQLYNYHGGGTRGLFLCEQAPPGPKSTLPSLDPLITPPGSESP